MVMHKGIKYYPSIQELSPSKSHMGAFGLKDLGIVNPGGHFYPKRVKGMLLLMHKTNCSFCQDLITLL